MTEIRIEKAGPAMSVQDLGRMGLMEFGLSKGGAMDRDAIYQGAALLSQSPNLAVIEMAKIGGRFVANNDIRIALTGTQMRSKIGDEMIAWNTSHSLKAGECLEIGAALKGNYGYLHIGGGIDNPPILGSRSTQIASGIDRILRAGDMLPIGEDKNTETGLTLEFQTDFTSEKIRILPGLHYNLFDEKIRKTFSNTIFHPSPQANRMGIKMEGAQFETSSGRSLLSETVIAGDIQITGDGTPYVLMSECQTIGGYPRIATIISADLPKIAQAASGSKIQFEFINFDEAIEIERAHQNDLENLPKIIKALIRNPNQISDLLSYQLISGVIAGEEWEEILYAKD